MRCERAPAPYAVFACRPCGFRGNVNCYGPLLSLMEKTQSAMNPSAHSLILPISISGASFLLPPLEDQIADFLDGRTHGESLLHALYDHVLDEPIPERTSGGAPPPTSSQILILWVGSRMKPSLTATPIAATAIGQKSPLKI